MKPVELTILGSNSATPAFGRFPTSQVLNISGDLILLDCGEGCQIRMSEYKVKRNNINFILISHLHGDHIYGLPGLIGSLAHLSRIKPLDVYGPLGLREYLATTLRVSQSHIPFDLKIHEINPAQVTQIVDQTEYEIFAFPVNHRITTYGYLIKEKPLSKKIKKEAIAAYNLSISEIKSIKLGEPLIRTGKRIENSQLVHESSPLISYAYCADTTKEGWDNSHLEGIHSLYMETTYLHELVDKAHDRKHATAKEAGQLAKELGVQNLIIGHYSSRYKDVKPLLLEAQSEFPNTFQGYDGFILNLK